MPINNVVPVTEPQANPDDYEYLCEDGSRRPLTGPACSWAQRPWQGYMSNGDVSTRLAALQQRIVDFYEAGKSADKTKAAKLWITDKLTVVHKEKQTLPGEHLTRAQYKDVIERDGSFEKKIRLCVRTDVEKRKCDLMKLVAYSRDIRPEIECILNGDCVESVKSDLSDVAILSGSELSRAKDGNDLKAIAHESKTTASETGRCNRAATVFVTNRADQHGIDNVMHAFSALSDKFGHMGNVEEVFELFGEFEPGQKNVLFSDDADKLIPVEPDYLKNINLSECH